MRAVARAAQASINISLEKLEQLSNSQEIIEPPHRRTNIISIWWNVSHIHNRLFFAKIIKWAMEMGFTQTVRASECHQKFTTINDVTLVVPYCLVFAHTHTHTFDACDNATQLSLPLNSSTRVFCQIQFNAWPTFALYWMFGLCYFICKMYVWLCHIQCAVINR